MKIKYAVTILMLFILVDIPVNSQVTQLWVNSFGNPGNNRSCKTLVDKFTGDIYVLSNNVDELYVINLVKYGSNGRQLWARTYTVAGHKCQAFDMTLDNLGGIIIAGHIEKINSFPLINDYLTVKYSSNGIISWVRKFSGPPNSMVSPRKVITDGNGGVIVTGTSMAGLYDILTVKYSFDGTLEWSKRYSTDLNYHDIPNSMAIDGDGNIYITGYTGITYITSDKLVLKYSSRGDLVWIRKDTLRGEQQGLQVINNEALDEIYILSKNYYRDSVSGDATVECFDRQGNSKWSSALPYAYEPRAILDETDNRLYSYGFKDTAGYILRVLNLNMQGRVIWSKNYNAGLAIIYTADIAIDDYHNIYLVSNSHTGGNGVDCYTTKFNSNGDELWVTSMGTSGLENKYSNNICLDNDNNIIVSGSYSLITPFFIEAIFTAKYSQGILPRFSSEIPENFTLKQNYPNPFNPSTQIKYDLPLDANVKITVFDMLGKEIAVLVNEHKAAGSYDVSFDASQLSSGMYFYRIQAGSFTDVKKMMLIR